MKASIIGATGATGKDLLELLLNDNNYKEINIFVRRDITNSSPKLNTNIIDFNQPKEWKELVKGDVLFSCLGTTLKAAGSKEKQWKIDYEYQYEFAKAAKENGVKNYVLISAEYASSKSVSFYSKMKGQLEDTIKKLGFEKTIIFHPPLLIRENSTRSGELWAVKTIKFLNALGILKSQKPLPTKVLAKSMIDALEKLENGTYTIGKKEISTYINE